MFKCCIDFSNEFRRSPFLFCTRQSEPCRRPVWTQYLTRSASCKSSQILKHCSSNPRLGARVFPAVLSRQYQNMPILPEESSISIAMFSVDAQRFLDVLKWNTLGFWNMELHPNQLQHHHEAKETENHCRRQGFRHRGKDKR